MTSRLRRFEALDRRGDDDNEALWWLALMTVMRWGEILGLRWEDGDRQRGARLPPHPNSLASRFRRLIAAARVSKIRFHDLRHTSATLMLANGIHPNRMQERLGHADISMTLNRCSHVARSMRRDAAS